MTATSHARPLELTVSNFGPIAEASIKLRPMCVFVGPSNTGKSYMAALIYALHRFFNWYHRSSDYGFSRSGLLGNKAHQMIPHTSDPDLSKDDIRDLFAWAKETLPNLEAGHPCELPKSIAALAHPMLNSISRLSEDLDGEITRCFGVNKSENLIRYPDGRTSFSLRGKASREDADDGLYEYNVKIRKQGTEIDASIPNAISLRIGWDINIINHFPWQWLDDSVRLKDEEREDEDKEKIALSFLGALASDIVVDTVGPLARPAHYLPADRAGVMHAHQVAVRGLIAGASRTGLRRDAPMPVLSGVLGDFMEQLVALADPSMREQDEDYDHLARNLEQTLLRGAVRVEQSPVNYPAVVFQPNGWKRDLPLMNASSMVSELAPVVLYLRHVVQPGDLLIIEEPEAHLHPAMQVEFTRQLAAAVRSGIRIIITTHSEWVLEELANLVRLAALPEERREGIDHADTALSPDQLGAWFFEPGSEGNGSMVREISLDTESATFPAGFGLVTESLYNRWAEISACIQEG